MRPDYLGGAVGRPIVDNNDAHLPLERNHPQFVDQMGNMGRAVVVDHHHGDIGMPVETDEPFTRILDLRRPSRIRTARNALPLEGQPASSGGTEHTAHASPTKVALSLRFWFAVIGWPIAR